MPPHFENVLNAMRVPIPKGPAWKPEVPAWKQTSPLWNPQIPAWNVYQIGCVSTPLNFASQQMRAFKLTHALDQAASIKGNSIAVVGAGLAGITAAVVCLLRGAKKVALYDRTHELMAFQHGTLHRYVHPLIFRWPEPGAEISRTEFPILNWSENTADAIRQEVVSEAERLLEECYRARHQGPDSDVFQFRLGCDVRQLLPLGTKVQLLAEGQESMEVRARKEYLPVGPIRNYQRRYDIVIVAVGFGLESELPGVPFRSYWHLDTLSQPTIRGNWPRRWLVSGTGDGGLIDAIRLRLFDTDQKTLTDVLTGHNVKIRGFETPPDWANIMNQMRRELAGLDQRIRSRFGTSRDFDAISREIQREFVEITHSQTDAFDTLKSFLESRERTDTVVYLNGPAELPYELGASLFQRFLIYLLRRHCGLRYRGGKLRCLTHPGLTGAYRFAFDRPEQQSVRMPTDLLEVDEVVIRHGAESALGGLLGAPAVDSVRFNKDRIQFEQSLWTETIDPSWASQLKVPILP